MSVAEATPDVVNVRTVTASLIFGGPNVRAFWSALTHEHNQDFDDSQVMVEGDDGILNFTVYRDVESDRLSFSCVTVDESEEGQERGLMAISELLGDLGAELEGDWFVRRKLLSEDNLDQDCSNGESFLENKPLCSLFL